MFPERMRLRDLYFSPILLLSDIYFLIGLVTLGNILAGQRRNESDGQCDCGVCVVVSLPLALSLLWQESRQKHCLRLLDSQQSLGPAGLASGWDRGRGQREGGVTWVENT